jgi:hypothetical protein
MSGRIERIIVPFDPTSETRGAIAIEARLAAHGKARLLVSLLRTSLY